MIATTAPAVEKTYEVALDLVEEINHGLESGTRHYRTKNGKLLTTLDEVVQAILGGYLATLGENSHG